MKINGNLMENKGEEAEVAVWNFLATVRIDDVKWLPAAEPSQRISTLIHYLGWMVSLAP
jgi:hypothetical protein